MKILTINLIFVFVLFCQSVFAAEGHKPHAKEVCTTINLKSDIKSFWYVPNNRPEVHFVTLPNGDSLKKYLIRGDLVVASKETPEFLCAHYIKKGKAATSGWLRKSDVEEFKLVSFGSFEVQESQKKIPKANNALISLAKRLPEIKDWRGVYQDKYGNRVKIRKKGSMWRLDTTGINGAIGSGNEEEDSQNLVSYGARAEYREDSKKYDVCDIVIVGFNNALLATSGSHCMGSGANHECPEFNGLYWKR